MTRVSIFVFDFPQDVIPSKCFTAVIRKQMGIFRVKRYDEVALRMGVKDGKTLLTARAAHGEKESRE